VIPSFFIAVVMFCLVLADQNNHRDFGPPKRVAIR